MLKSAIKGRAMARPIAIPRAVTGIISAAKKRTPVPPYELAPSFLVEGTGGLSLSFIAWTPQLLSVTSWTWYLSAFAPKLPETVTRPLVTGVDEIAVATATATVTKSSLFKVCDESPLSLAALTGLIFTFKSWSMVPQVSAVVAGQF